MSMVQRGDAVGDRTPLSMAVIDAIAEQEGIDPVKLDTPIYDVVDLDALDDLTASDADTTTVEVSFTYEGYEVTVDNGRNIDIAPIDER